MGKNVFTCCLALFIFCSLVKENFALAKESEMVFVPAGNYDPFYRDQDKTDQSIQVGSFYLDTYPVTNKDFVEFVTLNKKWRRSQAKFLFREKTYLQHWTDDLSVAEELEKSPVVNVSWFAARAYCESKKKRLPSMDEWEYVARAGTKAKNGNKEKGFLKRILDWYGKPSVEKLPPVGSTYKNYFGIFDMNGLIWEWVEDFNTVLLTGESRGDSGVERKLYCAAGSVGTANPEDYAAFMRFAFRASLKAKYSSNNLGFRCAKEK